MESLIKVTSRLEFSNALLYGLPESSLFRLQKVQNTAARLVSRTRKFSPITPLLCDLHWLPVQQRITFKILLLTFNALNGFALSYLSELVSLRSHTRTLKSSFRQEFLLLSVRPTNVEQTSASHQGIR